MPLGDPGDGVEMAARQQPDRQAGSLGRRPKPVNGTVGPPTLLMRLVEGEAQPQHPRLLLPGIDKPTVFRPLDCKVSEYRELLRVLPSGVYRGRNGLRQGARRMEQRGIDAGFMHLGQRIIFE